MAPKKGAKKTASRGKTIQSPTASSSKSTGSRKSLGDITNASATTAPASPDAGSSGAAVKLNKGGKKSKSGDKNSAKKFQKQSFKHHLHKILQQVHGDGHRMTSRTANIMDNMMHDIFEKFATQAAKLLRYRSQKSRTLSSKDIQTAVKLIFPGELAKHAIAEGTKAVNQYLMSM